MNQHDAWAPVLNYLAEQGFPLPDKVQIKVAGHTIEVEVPQDLQTDPSD